MILVFGGTTEGRKAVEALEEAGTPFFYSTRSDEQQLELVNGIHLTGGMDVSEMTTFCHTHDIRLFVDAAHPFATQLHANLLMAAAQTHLPVVRYERIYPPRDDSIVWCEDYADAVQKLEAHGVERLLALTGVNTLPLLSNYWHKHECWWRILNREASREMARKAGFPPERLVYYEETETDRLLERLHPQAILTKESGVSGGFEEKVRVATARGVKVYAVQRPPYPPITLPDHQLRIAYVNGPHGLRRMVERLLPDFYPLHSGLTTGTCATAASVAATLRLLHGKTPKEVPVRLPDGETITVAVAYGEGYAAVVKEAGDDPDVTDGLEIRASVEASDTFRIVGGEGVGVFTLPGFDFPPGCPAINKTPRQMIHDNLKPLGEKFQVTISVPQGAEIARRTFNPRLGIEGGISIIGVSGIVKPFSEEAFVGSIRKCMEVAKASGTGIVVINSGAKSERHVKARFPELPRQAFVEYGNYIGETLKIAEEMGFPHVVLGVMLGKAVKLAAGHLDTHSRKSVMDKLFVGSLLEEAGCPIDIGDIALARELWGKIPSEKVNDFAKVVIRHCAHHCSPLIKKSTLTIFLIDDEGTIYE